MDTFAMIALADTGTLTLLSGVAIFLAITLILVIVLLIAKKFLVHSGEVRININNDKDVFAMSGKTLLSTLGDQNIFLSSACGGKAAAVNARCRFLKVEATYFPQRPCTSPANR